MSCGCELIFCVEGDLLSSLSKTGGRNGEVDRATSGRGIGRTFGQMPRHGPVSVERQPGLRHGDTLNMRVNFATPSCAASFHLAPRRLGSDEHRRPAIRRTTFRREIHDGSSPTGSPPVRGEPVLQTICTILLLRKLIGYRFSLCGKSPALAVSVNTPVRRGNGIRMPAGSEIAMTPYLFQSYTNYS